MNTIELLLKELEKRDALLAQAREYWLANEPAVDDSPRKTPFDLDPVKSIDAAREATFAERVRCLNGPNDTISEIYRGSDYQQLRDRITQRRGSVDALANRVRRKTGVNLRTTQFLTEAAPGILVGGLLVIRSDD